MTKRKINFERTSINKDPIVRKDFSTLIKPGSLLYDLSVMYFSRDHLQNIKSFKNIGNGPCQLIFNQLEDISIQPNTLNMNSGEEREINFNINSLENYRNLLEKGENLTVSAQLHNVFDDVQLPANNIPNLSIPLVVERLLNSIEFEVSVFGNPVNMNQFLNRNILQDKWSFRVGLNNQEENVELLNYDYVKDGMGYFISKMNIKTQPDDDEKFEKTSVTFSIDNTKNSIYVWRRIKGSQSTINFSVLNEPYIISLDGFNKEINLSGREEGMTGITFYQYNQNHAAGPTGLTPFVLTTKENPLDGLSFKMNIQIGDEINKDINFKFKTGVRGGVQ